MLLTLIVTTTEQTRVWNTIIRGDHQVNRNHTYSVRWLRETSPQQNQIIGAVTADRLETLREADWIVIDEIKGDMESDKPKDRLVVGDVGYGKTEVALRTAFIAAMNGKQVAVVVPTTLLARQHYATFSERFKGLPLVTIACFVALAAWTALSIFWTSADDVAVGDGLRVATVLLRRPR